MPAHDWKRSPADPAAFTASAGTWTGAMEQNYKIVDNNQLIVLFRIEATSVSAPSSALFWQMPEERVTADEFLAPIIYWQDGIGFTSGLVQAYGPDQDKVMFMRFRGQWPQSYGRIYLWGQFIVPIKPIS